MKKRIIVLFFCSLGLSKSLFAQLDSVYTFRGRVVTASDNTPLQGVRINAVGSDEVSLSDRAGMFTISIEQHVDSLIFTYVGYTQQSVSARNFQKAELTKILLEEQMNKIEEVVVSTGYQTLKANEVTGSVQVLDNKMLNQQIGTNVLERINNISTAVRFDNQPLPQGSHLQKTNVSIRGLSTINGSLDPLIVLDGYIYEGDIANIDPNNVDNITILKDAAAASIWGARAGNGVIVITSKGAGTEQKFSLSFNNTVTVKELSNLYNEYQLNNADFIGIEEMLFQNGYYDRQISRTPHLVLTPATEIFYQRRQGNITSADSAASIQALMGQDFRKAFTEEFLVRPIVQQYSLNIRGSSPVHAYNLGLGYTKSKGESGSGKDKMNVLLGNSFRPTSKLKIDLNVMFTNQRGRSGMPNFDRFNYGGKYTPYGRFRTDDGTPVAYQNLYRQEFVDSFPPGALLDWSFYPLDDYKYSKGKTNLTEFYPTVNASYKLFPFLSLNLGGQYQYQSSENSLIDQVESYAARKIINRFTSIDKATGEVIHRVPIGGVRNSSRNEVSSYTLRAQANVDKHWNDHRLVGVLGAEIRENLDNGESFTVYGYSDKPLNSVPVDYSQSYPVLPSGSGSISGTPYYTQIRNRFISTYGTFSYLFRDRYGLSASLRSDGANIFGATTNDKWSPLWSTGVLWNIDKENFFPTDVFSTLKFRATYGFSGNVDLRRTPVPIAGSSTGYYSNLPSLQVIVLNDPSLRWEKVGTLNFGLDFAIANNRISGNVDYYIKKGTDLYGNSAYDYTVWGQSPFITKNAASMRGTGVDLMVNSKNLTGEFEWETVWLFSYNQSLTKEYYERFYRGLSSFLNSGHSINPIEGMPLYGIAAYKWAGLDKEGNPQGYLDGVPSTDYRSITTASTLLDNEGKSIEFFGSGKPQVFGSIINTFRYKQFDLSVNISFKGDYSFRKPTTGYEKLFEDGIAYPDFEQRWQKPGDERKTNVPSIIYPASGDRDRFYKLSEINVHSGDHIRLEYINVSYTPTLGFIRSAPRINIYMNASNLGLLWTKNKEGIDPEFPYRLKPQKTFAFGVKANF